MLADDRPDLTKCSHSRACVRASEVSAPHKHTRAERKVNVLAWRGHAPGDAMRPVLAVCTCVRVDTDTGAFERTHYMRCAITKSKPLRPTCARIRLGLYSGGHHVCFVKQFGLFVTGRGRPKSIEFDAIQRVCVCCCVCARLHL